MWFRLGADLATRVFGLESEAHSETSPNRTETKYQEKCLFLLPQSGLFLCLSHDLDFVQLRCFVFLLGVTTTRARVKREATSPAH